MALDDLDIFPGLHELIQAEEEEDEEEAEAWTKEDIFLSFTEQVEALGSQIMCALVMIGWKTSSRDNRWLSDIDIKNKNNQTITIQININFSDSLYE